MKELSQLCKRVLVVAAHPDDEVLGCGATIAMLARQGCEVNVLVVGEGSSCRFDTKDLSRPDVAEAIRVREDSARRAIHILGPTVGLHLNRFPCGRFDQVPIIEIGKLVESHIARLQPDTILTHSSVDANNDHRLCFQAVLQATRPIPGQGVKRVLSFEIPSSSEWKFVDSFRPNIFLDISDALETKLAAMAAYGAENRPFPFPRSPKGLETFAQLRGMQSGAFAAEAFELVRWIP